jgi:hypothetical protein
MRFVCDVSCVSNETTGLWFADGGDCRVAHRSLLVTKCSKLRAHGLSCPCGRWLDLCLLTQQQLASQFRRKHKAQWLHSMEELHESTMRITEHDQEHEQHRPDPALPPTRRRGKPKYRGGAGPDHCNEAENKEPVYNTPHQVMRFMY